MAGAIVAALASPEASHWPVAPGFPVREAPENDAGTVIATPPLPALRASAIVPHAMGPTVGFWISFFSTLTCLVVALVSGWRGRRRLHLVFGPLTFVALTAAIVFTEELMRSYTFPEASLRFHLWFAKTGALLAVPVIVTGVLLLRRPQLRRLHLVAVMLFVVGALVATGTGLWLFQQGTPK